MQGTRLSMGFTIFDTCEPILYNFENVIIRFSGITYARCVLICNAAIGICLYVCMYVCVFVCRQ